MKNNKLDFNAINAIALASFESLLRQWLPDGKKSGAEYTSINPTRNDSHPGSFSINIFKGKWKDFATGDSGNDPVSLYAYLFHHNDQGAAAKELSDQLGVSTQAKKYTQVKKNPPSSDLNPVSGKSSQSDWLPVIPPDNVPEPHKAHIKRGFPEQIWCYRSSEGAALGYVYRFKTSDGGKVTLPLSWCRNRVTGAEEWRWMAFSIPRWLYGLDRLEVKPDAPVLIVEGEKCADAAADELPHLACVTWPGGSKAVDKADWSPLAGRDVIIWPDCDSQRNKAGDYLPFSEQPGMAAANRIADKLLAMACRVWMLDIAEPGEKTSGWDIANAIDEGLRGEELRLYIRANARLLTLADVPPQQCEAKQIPVSRQSFEAELEEAGSDIDQLLRITTSLQLSALHTAEIELLLKRAAKVIGVSINSLRNNKRKHEPPGGGGFGINSEDYVEELNSKHAIVPIAGRVLVMNQEWDPALERNMITFSSAQDLQLRYFNQKTWAKGKETDIASVWLEHPLRRQYEGVVFAPGKDVPEYFNLFQGFGIEPKQGLCNFNPAIDWTFGNSVKAGECIWYKRFVFEVICTSNLELFNYLWRWLAHLFQKPAELPGTAFVLRGKQGVGKNTFVEAIGVLVGSGHFIQLSNIQQVTGRFSGHLADCLLVFANEAIWGGDKTAEGSLKHMVTDPITAIERKGRDIIAMNNYKRLIAASNEDWVIPRGMDDRRFIIIDVDDGYKEEHDYFARIKKELVNGGYQALMAELLAIDLSKYEPRTVPEQLKEIGWELKIRSGGSVVQWWFSVLSDGYLWEFVGYADEQSNSWPEEAIKNDVYNHYIGFCKKLNFMHLELLCTIGTKLKSWGVGPGKRPRDKEKETRPYHYKFMSLEICRQKFSALYSIPMTVWEDYDDD